MPPDAFLALCSSGLTLIACVLFWPVSERARPTPMRLPAPVVVSAPPAPVLGGSRVDVELDDEGFVLHLESLADERGATAGNLPVHDVRWHGKAVLKTTRRASWRVKAGLA